MKKTLVALVMALSLGVCGIAKSATLVDVPQGHWAADAVNRLAEMGLVQGYPDGTYKGGQPMTRYEYAMIVSRMVDWANKTFCAKEDCKGGTITTTGGKEVDISGLATKADVEEAKAIIKKLSAEFKDELAALKQQVDKNTNDIDALSKRIDGLPFANMRVSGSVRQRIDVLDTDLTPGNLTNMLASLHGIAGVTSLNAGYELVPNLLFQDAVATDNVFYSIGLKQHIANDATLGSIALGNANKRQLDIDHAYVVLDFTKSIRELDDFRVTSGYQKVAYGPYAAMINNAGVDSQAGVRLDLAKDIVSLSGFGALASASGNGTGAGLGTSSKPDPYIATRLGLNLNSLKVGFNYLPNGVAQEKAWGADLDAKLLKNSPFLTALRAEYYTVTDTVAGASPAATEDDNSVIVGLDVYKTKRAGLTLSYADLPAVTVLNGLDSSWATEYDTNCPMGVEASFSAACINAGNALFPAGFKGVGVEASYVVLGDVELGGKAIFGDFAGGTIPSVLVGGNPSISAKGLTYPGYGTLSVAKPINKTSKFRVEYTQQGKDPVMLSRVRGELLINF